jgi:hypothetical protein
LPLWNQIFATAIFLELYLAPLTCVLLNAFEGAYYTKEEILSGSMYKVDIAIDCVFVVTMILKLTTAIKRNDKVIKVWSVIAKEYVFTGMFIFDVASTAPIFISIYMPMTRKIYFLKLIRMCRFSTWKDSFSEFLLALL